MENLCQICHKKGVGKKGGLSENQDIGNGYIGN
jgi:hypothetical protein